MSRSRKKKEIFKTVRETAVFRAWLKVLELQVTLFSNKELRKLEEFGLSDGCGPLLDVGCGPGFFAARIRARFPKLDLVCADLNKEMLKEFRAPLKNNPDDRITILQWTAGESDLPKQVRACRSVIMRLVLQHTPDPSAVLRQLNAALPKGNKIFIIEEDDGLFQIDPEFDPFREVIKTWNSYVSRHSGDRFMGRKLNRLCERAGLKVLNCETVSHTNVDIGIESLMAYLQATMNLIALSSPKVITLSAAKALGKELGHFAKSNKKACFLNYPQIITMAETK